MRVTPLLLLAAATFVAAGCVSRPTPPYRRVDTAAPAFQTAFARETAVETAKGKSADEAAEIATKRVQQAFIATEKQRRTDDVAPLVAALTDLERPRGCWSYVVSTTTRKAEGVTLTVERYDPFQPEEKLWTLLSRNGQSPTEEQQADYRRARLKQWRQQQTRAEKRKPTPERVTRNALYAELAVVPATDGASTTFTFNRAARHLTLVGDLPPMREVCTLATPQSRLTRRTQTALGQASIFGGMVRIISWNTATDYVVVDPALPPFVAKSTLRYQAAFFGQDSGEVLTDSVYTDYRRVKCYDDRFEVRIGEPSMSDLMPAKE